MGFRTFSSIIIFTALLLLVPAYANNITSCEAGCIDTHNLEINNVVLNEGKNTYTIPAAKTDAERDHCEESGWGTFHPEICEKGGVITCDERVEYPQFKYLRHHYGNMPDDELKLINEQFKNMAEEHKCSADFENIGFEADRIYARNNLLSIVFNYVDYPVGAGGSCHGGHKTMTFDTLKSATPLSLADIIEQDDLPILKSFLSNQLQNRSHTLDEMYKIHKNPDELKRSDAALSKVVEEYLDSGGWNGGFFIEHGVVQINIDKFFFSCAEGNFIPLEVPDRFLRPDFLKVLEDARQQG